MVIPEKTANLSENSEQKRRNFIMDKFIARAKQIKPQQKTLEYGHLTIIIRRRINFSSSHSRL